jgi:two-component system, LytTR family, response regulator
MIRALLVDDEKNNLDSLEYMLQNDCEGITVAGKVTDANAARKWLSQNSADVLFLDINMPGEDGFRLLSSLSPHHFRVVFGTAYNEYAIQAIKASALDYLLKPINIEELQITVDKIRHSIDHPLAGGHQQQLINHFLDTITHKTPPKKIALPHLGGISFIDVDDIVSLQADSNYTILHLVSMQKLVISKTLKDFEELLDVAQFARIHKSYIIQLRHIKEYSTSDGGMVKMTDGNQWSISRRQLDLFLQKMKTASLMFGK